MDKIENVEKKKCEISLEINEAYLPLEIDPIYCFSVYSINDKFVICYLNEIEYFILNKFFKYFY